MLRTMVAMSITMAILAWPARAEVPPRKVEELTKEATHIFDGKVTGVASEVKKGEKEGFADTIYTFDIEVTKVEKGEGVKAGETIQATTWKVKERPKGIVGAGGQYVIPKKDNEVRVYLRKDEKGGKYTLLLPNGLEVTKK